MNVINQTPLYDLKSTMYNFLTSNKTKVNLSYLNAPTPAEFVREKTLLELPGVDIQFSTTDCHNKNTKIRIQDKANIESLLKLSQDRRRIKRHFHWIPIFLETIIVIFIFFLNNFHGQMKCS